MPKNKQRDGIGYLRPQQVAVKLGVNVATVWRWVLDKRKNFPQPIKLSYKVTVFAEHEIDAFINALKRTHGDKEND